MATSECSEYRTLRKVLQDNLDALDRETDAAQLPDFHVTKPEPHPADDPQWLPSPGLLVARSNCVASLNMMRAMIESPGLQAVGDGLAHWNSVALQMVVRTDVIKLLLSAGANGVPIKEPSERTGVNENKLVKLMHLLANKHYFVERSEGRFALTRTGLMLSPNSPTRSNVAWMTWFSLGYASKVVDTWTDAKETNSFAPLDTPAAAAFEWEKLGCKELWDRGVPNTTRTRWKIWLGDTLLPQVPCTSIVTDYEWASLPKDSLVVDVGGGSGRVSSSIVLKYPHLRAVVQDCPEVSPAAELEFKTQSSEAFTQERIQFEPIDFFKETPHEGAAVYILRFIMHDLDDDRAAVVLENVAKAMSHTSRLLIIDFIIIPATIAGTREADEESDSPNVPFPLSKTAAMSHMPLLRGCEMSGVLIGTERRVAQSRALLDRVGLKLNKVNYTRGPLDIIIEVTRP